MSAARAAAAPPSDAVERFLDEAVDSYRRSAGTGGQGRDIVIGSGPVETRIRLHVVEALEPMVAALAPPAPSHDGDPHLELYALAGPGLPPPPWPPNDFLPSGELRGSTEGRLLAAFSVDGRILNVLDRVRGVGVFLCADAAELPSWEYGAPLRHLLRWGLIDHGWQLVHAAAAGGARGSALLVGRGGSGKSTTTIACLRAGMQSVGDDYCAVHVDSRCAHALFDTAKLADDSLARFPGMATARREVAPSGDKAHLSLRGAFPDRLVDRLPLRSIVLLTVGTRTGTAARATASQALRALAPSTLLQLPGARSETLAALGRLTRALPAWTLTVGPDLDRVPRAVASVLDAEAPQ